MAQLPKPDACKGCPFYSKGNFYVPDRVVEDSPLFFLAQNPGPDEEAGRKLKERHWLGYGQHWDDTEEVTPQPLIGTVGQLFNNKFLSRTHYARQDVSVGNAIRCRPGAGLGLKTDELPKLTSTMTLDTSKSDFVRAIRHCTDAHLRIPEKTNMFVAMGAVALFALTGQHSVIDWRGYVIRTTRHNVMSHISVNVDKYHDVSQPQRGDDIDVFVTTHIAGLYKGDNKRYYHATLNDFSRLHKFITKQWPHSLPTWHVEAPDAWPAVSVFDTEYDPVTQELIRWSLCKYDGGISDLYCVEAINTPGAIQVPFASTVIMQNALADIGHLSGIIDMSDVHIEDLMLAHAVLWTGEPHSLNYIASMYGAFNRYKHLNTDEPQLYSALDAFEPMYIWTTAIMPAFRSDRQSWLVYRQYVLPLIPIINKAQQTGLRLDGSRLKFVRDLLQEQVNELQHKARQVTKEDGLNLGGRKDILRLIYGEDEIT